MSQAKVFVVDDDESVRKALQRLIRSAGMLAQTFASSEEFLDAHVALPDCLILDVRMPGMSGLELQRHLIAENQHVPVIFICGHDDEISRGRALAAGAIEFFFKPFDPEKLLAAISRTLALQEAAHENVSSKLPRD